MKYFAFLRWWLIVSGIISLVIIAYFNGFGSQIIDSGLFINMIIIGITGIMTIVAGYATFHSTRTSTIKFGIRCSDLLFWVIGLCFSLGLLGTIIGFSKAIGSLGGVDFNNAISSKNAFIETINGVRYALNTTFVGIISGMILGIQRQNLEWYLVKKEQNEKS